MKSRLAVTVTSVSPTQRSAGSGRSLRTLWVVTRDPRGRGLKGVVLCPFSLEHDRPGGT